MILTAFDTETSGFSKGTPEAYNKATDPYDGNFAQIVSLGWASIDTATEQLDTGVIYARYDERNVWSSSAEEIHGLSRNFLEGNGISEEKVFDQFCTLSENSDLMIAHNIKFDMKMLYVAFLRKAKRNPAVQWHPYHVFRNAIPKFDTLGVAKFKKLQMGSPTAKLEDVHKHLIGTEFEAHGAMEDSVACLKVYLAMKSRGWC